MINHIYRLISPGFISVEFEDISLGDQVLVRPEYLSVCHADQRYYQGQRSAAILRKKLPMALIHECCGRVEYDPSGQFQPGQQVVLIPNIPPEQYPEDLYENYVQGARFLSSGHDGFLQELVAISPDRLAACDAIPGQVAAITEFVSVVTHAASRFDRVAHSHRQRIGIWGDGSLAYVAANVLQATFPQSQIIVIGKHRQKLSQFSFVHETYLAEDLPCDCMVDHAFECCGGVGSGDAIEQIIAHIHPQGTVMLMGVSENPIPVNTRMVLEKGLTLVGCSRSGKQDFLAAIRLMQNKAFCRRLQAILFEDAPVRGIPDIHRVFRNDLSTPFKTVFHWEM